jgi:DNA repair protein RecN (Recombination protein N)
VDKLDLDPAELAQVTERLNLVNRMVDKYTHGVGGNLEEVLAYRQQIGTQIDELRAQDKDFSTIGEEIAKLEKDLRDIGKALTASRKKSAERLLPLVHKQLADLGMKEAKFIIEFQPLDALGDVAKAKSPTARQGKAGPSAEELKLGVQDFVAAAGTAGGVGGVAGMETVEFMIAPNPGQPARPLRRIASGGELSRVMLALKGILAQADRVSVLVFDEIDANVGGRMGTIIGEKLRALAAIHQVLCITHLPQIAAFADRHLTIHKQTEKGQTVTTVAVMEGEQRVRELAEMTAGKEVSATALAQARELLEAGRVVAKKVAKSGKA